jgi:glutamate N-acetyltransferase/amino-acid N-acetyltransferase
MRGQEGVADIEKIFDVLKTKLPITNPIMSSTGVIGEPLPVEKIINGALKFNLTNKNNLNAARGIMTTDTYPKEIAVKVQLEDGREYFVGGMAKGAGMINPSMATMLAFITTDLKIPTEKINELLRELTKTTFNAISVDGDTSTNDSVFLLANGEKDFYDEVSFKATLEIVMKHLALEIVRDGEGATKLVSFRITGAKTNEDAEKVAKKLADSLLVKTAFFGQDPNWGRIAMAIGASGVSVSEERLSIYYNDLPIFVQGKNLWNDEVEEKAFEIMKNKQFVINCDLGFGDGSFTSYSSDIGYKYVQINSEYRS